MPKFKIHVTTCKTYGNVDKISPNMSSSERMNKAQQNALMEIKICKNSPSPSIVSAEKVADPDLLS